MSLLSSKSASMGSLPNPFLASGDLGEEKPSGSEPLLLNMSKVDDGTAIDTSGAKSIWTIVGVVAFYIFASISTILLNKSVLKVEGIPSLLFLWAQLVIAVIILQVARLFRLISLPPVNLGVFMQVFGLIAINVIGLALNTLCLANIDAVLYQVARSMILPMTVAMSPFIQGTYPTPKILAACSLIFVGFIVGLFGERHFSATNVTTAGIVFGILSSFSTSCHSFVIKSSFGSVQSQWTGTFDLVYYNNLFSSILLIPLLLVERDQILRFSSLLVDNPAVRNSFIWGTALSGASGLLINLAGFLQIKVTSPITHTVSSAARGVLQTIAAYFILGEAVTLPRCIGIGITLLGSCAYSWFKSQEATAYKKV